MMKITVILCTYNRCQNLARALESVAGSKLPESIEWEVLVVDNNSSDQTREVIEEFCRQHVARFRYLFESRQGKSYALNTGIREAQGDILAFTDDDLTVDPMWLQNLTAALDNGEWVGSGGRTIPDKAFSAPRWLWIDGKYALSPLGMFDIGEKAGEFTEPPIGNNMAYRKKMFEKHGGFRTDLGPCPGSEVRSEDTEFGQRLLSVGERLWYEPSAVVYHSTPPNRIRKDYFLGWWSAKARANIREFGSPVDARWLIAGVPLVLFRRLAVWTLRWMFAAELVSYREVRGGSVPRMQRSRFNFENDRGRFCVSHAILRIFCNGLSARIHRLRVKPDSKGSIGLFCVEIDSRNPRPRPWLSGCNR
jgi:glycosyltransferase involved in cell wall biosynthesis